MDKPPPLTRKDREKKFRTDLVLDAAFRVFSERPFAKVSVEDIASAAEMSVGTLYSLFETKGEIFRAMVSRQQRGVLETVNARVDAATSPRRKVHAFIEGYFEAFVTNASGWQLYATAAAGFELAAKREIINEARRAQDETAQRVLTACEEGLSAGEFKSGVPPELMTLTIMMIPHAYFTYVFEHMETDIMTLVPSALRAVDRVIGIDN